MNSQPTSNEPPVMIGMILNEGEPWQIVTTVDEATGRATMAHYETTGTFTVSTSERVHTTYAPVALALWDIVYITTGAAAHVQPSEGEVDTYDVDDDRRL